MDFVTDIITPQLKKIHSGKVRESFFVDNETRMILVTDRVSSFDSVLNNLIPYKGAVLNGLAAYWFKETEHIVSNHFIKMIHPNISFVREAIPIKIEMIVRGYITGSMWRGYEKGKRIFSGVKVEEGLKKNQKLVMPIITPTTKEEHDREITPEDIIREGWATAEQYAKMEEISLRLYEFAAEKLKKAGIILVDTKYEFGIYKGNLILIDEIHTPDSSRFWDLKEYEKNPSEVDSIDKEYIRQWLLKNKKNGKLPSILPDNVIKEASKRYLQIYKRITGKNLKTDYNSDIKESLIKNGIIKDGSVILIMGSESDLKHAEKIREVLIKYDVFTQFRIVSAHKNGERITELAKVYNNSIEPISVIAIAGRSNGLGGALAANLVVPVINCPPFKDKLDFMVNISSSLMMPSKTPAMTVVDVSSAALAALRSLNLKRLKEIFIKEIEETKKTLLEADNKVKKI